MDNIKYDFKLVEKGSIRSFEPYISLSSNTFRFNSAFCRENDLEKLPYVNIFFDRDKMAIAFRFISSRNPSTFKINYTNGRGSVSAIALFKEEQLNSNDYKGRYLPERHDDAELGRMFVICLKKATV